MLQRVSSAGDTNADGRLYFKSTKKRSKKKTVQAVFYCLKITLDFAICTTGLHTSIIKCDGVFFYSFKAFSSVRKVRLKPGFSFDTVEMSEDAKVSVLVTDLFYQTVAPMEVSHLSFW